jgi:hypothetical protein
LANTMMSPRTRSDETAVPPTRLTLLTAARAFGVVYGPPLLATALIGSGLVAAARRHLDQPPRTRTSILLRGLAALGAAAPAVYPLLVRPWLLRWGATEQEVHQSLPGDDLVPHPWIESTRAVTIDAPFDAVWPWLAQIGQDRGGFYSYEWLENLAGCEMHNADRIHPEWQRRAVGELVRLHPQAGLKVTHFEPGRAIGLEGWGAFVLEPLDEHHTRLIARSRSPRTWPTLALAPLGEIPHFVMERKMLLGIKERAERAGCAS